MTRLGNIQIDFIDLLYDDWPSTEKIHNLQASHGIVSCGVVSVRVSVCLCEKN